MKKIVILVLAVTSTVLLSAQQPQTKPKTTTVKQTGKTQGILIGMNNPSLLRFSTLKKKPVPLFSVSSPNVQRIRPVSGSATSNSISRTPTRDNKRPGTSTKERDEEGRYCVETVVSEQNGEFEKIVLGNQSDKILPGAIYFDNSIMDGSYNAPTNLSLKPYKITSSMFSATSTGSSSVEVQPTMGGIKDGISELMRRNTRVLNPAIVDVQASNIYSAEQLSFFLQADYQGYGVDLNAEFNYERRQKKNLIFVKLKQVYFSVNVDHTSSGSSLVTNASVPSNLIYVNKVNFGRIGILKIESDSSVEAIRAALRFSYNGGGNQVGVSGGADYQKVLAGSKVEGFFFGGDAADAFPVTSVEDLPLFNQYVRNGMRLNPAVAPVPISYELKYLNDNATASINSVTTYTERSCETAKSIKVTLNGISIEDIHGGDCSYAWGSVKVEMYELNDRGGVVRRVMPVTDNLKEEPVNLIWNKPDGRNPQRGMINYAGIRGEQTVNMDNVNRSWNFYIDPTVPQNRIAIKVISNINTNHKDNDFAALGFHGMNREESKTFKLDEVYITKEKLQAGEKRYGSMIAGPYTSHAGSDRQHAFRAHFTVTAGN